MRAMWACILFQFQWNHNVRKRSPIVMSLHATNFIWKKTENWKKGRTQTKCKQTKQATNNVNTHAYTCWVRLKKNPKLKTVCLSSYWIQKEYEKEKKKKTTHKYTRFLSKSLSLFSTFSLQSYKLCIYSNPNVKIFMQPHNCVHCTWRRYVWLNRDTHTPHRHIRFRARTHKLYYGSKSSATAWLHTYIQTSTYSVRERCSKWLCSVASKQNSFSFIWTLLSTGVRATVIRPRSDT